MHIWIEDFLNYMQASKGCSPRTIATYEDSLEAAVRFFVTAAGTGEPPSWTTLTTEDFRAWEAEQMARGFSPSYVQKNMAALRSFYRFLLKEGRVVVDPVHLVKNPKQHKRLPTFVRETEMDRLFDYYDFGEGFEGIRDRTILLILYHTGIRAAELLSLDVLDVDLQQSSLRVTGKGNKQRVIPFGKELQEALLIYIYARAREVEAFLTSEQQEMMANDSAANALIVKMPKPGRKGVMRRMTYEELRRLVNAALSTVTTQKKRSPHVLRHSFATAMLSHGAQLEAIQQLLGHETVATTAIYTHTTLTELKEQYQQAHPRNDEK